MTIKSTVEEFLVIVRQALDGASPQHGDTQHLGR
jgi:hypothetical protein